MEALTFDSVLLTGPIKCRDLSPLRDFAVRGSNRIFPGAPGQRATTLVRDQLDRTFDWLVTGVTEPDGTPYVDLTAGLEANLEYYRTLFTTGGLHDISLSFAGSTFTGECQVADYAQVRTSSITATIITRLVIPSGQLT